MVKKDNRKQKEAERYRNNKWQRKIIENRKRRNCPREKRMTVATDPAESFHCEFQLERPINEH